MTNILAVDDEGAAWAWIKADVQSVKDGRAGNETLALELSAKHDFDVDKVKGAYAEARAAAKVIALAAVAERRARLNALDLQRRAAKPEPVFICPEPQPEPEPEEEHKPAVAKVWAEPAPEKPALKSALWLPGVAGDIQGYYLETAMYPSEILSVGPALMVPAALISGKIIGPTGRNGCPTHGTTVALGPSGVGKQDLIDLTKMFLRKIGAAKLIGPNRFKSGTALINYVKRNSTALCVQDEFGSWLANKVCCEDALTCEREISDRMREFWGLQPGSVYNSPEGAGSGDQSETIEGICFSVLGFGVKEDFFAACKASDVVNGFLNRMLLLLEEDLPEENPNASGADIPYKLFEALTKLSNARPAKLEFAEGAREIWEERKRVVRAETDPVQRTLWARGPEQMVRMATTFAASRFDRTISRSDMKLAHELVCRSARTFEVGIEDAQAVKAMRHHELVQEVVRRLRKQGDMTQSQLERSFRHNKTHKDALGNAIGDLEQSGTIKQFRVETGGRPKQVYRVMEGEADI
jgi:hypothetical protein